MPVSATPASRACRRRLGADRCWRYHRPCLPSRSPGILQHRKDVAGARPRGRDDSLAVHCDRRVKIAVHAVGRMKAGPEKELADRYFDRFAKSGPSIGLEFSGVNEFPESRAPGAAERRRDEAQKLQAQLVTGAVLSCSTSAARTSLPRFCRKDCRLARCRTTRILPSPSAVRTGTIRRCARQPPSSCRSAR